MSTLSRTPIRIAKLAVVMAAVIGILSSCFSSKPDRFVIADSKLYEASIFRQNCAICHGPEGEGRTLDDGKTVPNLREGDFKYTTPEQIYEHIANGGNGMVPFKGQLTDREIRMMVNFVLKDLRTGQVAGTDVR